MALYKIFRKLYLGSQKQICNANIKLLVNIDNVSSSKNEFAGYKITLFWDIEIRTS